MKTFYVKVTFTDRKLGPGIGRGIRTQATSLPGAVGKVTREFWSGLNRKQRNDAVTSLKIEANELQEAPREVRQMVDRAIGSICTAANSLDL